VELSLMPVTRQWLPIEDGLEKQVVDRLLFEDRAFVKGLRYNLGVGSEVACATLTDCGGSAPELHIRRSDEAFSSMLTLGNTAWVWQPSAAPMPALPLRRSLATA
jgi:hypothetical protein